MIRKSGTLFSAPPGEEMYVWRPSDWREIEDVLR